MGKVLQFPQRKEVLTIAGWVCEEVVTFYKEGEGIKVNYSDDLTQLIELDSGIVKAEKNTDSLMVDIHTKQHQPIITRRGEVISPIDLQRYETK